MKIRISQQQMIPHLCIALVIVAMIHISICSGTRAEFALRPCSFHATTPQDGLEDLKTQEERCMRVLRPDITTVPYPLLGENTLVISDSLVLAPGADGHPRLQVRIGCVTLYHTFNVVVVTWHSIQSMSPKLHLNHPVTIGLYLLASSLLQYRNKDYVVRSAQVLHLRHSCAPDTLQQRYDIPMALHQVG